MAKNTLAGGMGISDDDFTDEELAIIYGTTRAGMGTPGTEEPETKPGAKNKRR